MKVIKYLLLFSVFILLGFHAVQRAFKIYPQPPLIGVADTTKRPAFTFNSD